MQLDTNFNQVSDFVTFINYFLAKLHTQLRHKYVGSGYFFIAVASDIEIHITKIHAYFLAVRSNNRY